MSGEDSNVCLVCKGNWILFGRPLYWKRDRKLALLSILTKEVYSRKKIAGGGRGEMFICSKLRQNLSEMELSTFERMQRVIWDHLLPFIKGWNYPEASFIFVSANKCRVIMLSVLFFLSFSFLARQVHFFRLNHVRKVRKRCSHSRFSSEAIILQFYDRNLGLCCSCFFGCCGRPWVLRWV